MSRTGRMLCYDPRDCVWWRVECVRDVCVCVCGGRAHRRWKPRRAGGRGPVADGRDAARRRLRCASPRRRCQSWGPMRRRLQQRGRWRWRIARRKRRFPAAQAKALWAAGHHARRARLACPPNPEPSASTAPAGHSRPRAPAPFWPARLRPRPRTRPTPSPRPLWPLPRFAADARAAPSRRAAYPGPHSPPARAWRCISPGHGDATTRTNRSPVPHTLPRTRFSWPSQYSRAVRARSGRAAATTLDTSSMWASTADHCRWLRRSSAAIVCMSGRSCMMSVSSRALRRTSSSARDGAGVVIAASCSVRRLSLLESVASSHRMRALSRSRPGSAWPSNSPCTFVCSSRRYLPPGATTPLRRPPRQRCPLPLPFRCASRAHVLDATLLNIQGHGRRTHELLQLATQPFH